MKKYQRIFSSCLLSISITSTIYSQTPNDNWVAPKEADNLVNLLAGLQPTPASKLLFQSNCMPCHGEGGKGDGPVGASLTPRPYNLTIRKVENETDGALFWRITNGHLSMPTFKNTLTAMERWQLVNYIRTLEQKADEDAKSKSKPKK
jgi:mono/diheme cytochrome c family protein